jgi:NAD(P)-dependent dehydrogenase (short-subunit alcohol dehydrogenase family)
MAMRFGEEHLRAFELASMDTSPLHTSESYARKTAFGERLVYGSLAVAACLARLPLPEGKVTSAIRVEYKGAMVLHVDYRLAVIEQSPGTIRAVLLDGTVPVMRVRLQLRDGVPRQAELPEAGIASRNQSRRNCEGFVPGMKFQGSYAPPRAAYLELLELIGLDRARWGDAVIIAVLCGGYLSGMEIPGESGASAALQADVEPQVELPCAYEIELDSYDTRFGRVASRFSLGRFAHGKLTAMVRPRLAQIVAPARAASQRFAGKTALVIGASRGLGAALALELASEGCTVVGAYARSTDDAAAIAKASGGTVRMEQGDASDPQWCAALRERMQAEFGGVDLLVLNAAPAILPLRVEEAHLGRIQNFVHQGFGLVAAPLASFLDLVDAAAGSVVLISAAAMERPAAAVPHYVALKGAVEGLVQAAAADHPKVRFTIARPERIATDLTNTPLGRMDAEEPATVARRLVDAVAGSTPGAVQFVS